MSGEDGYPYAIPLNFYFDESEETIYFHSAKEGHKIDAIRNNENVCFTVWNTGIRKEDDWAYYVTSIVVFGRAHLVTDEAVTREKARALGLKYFPTAEEVEEVMSRSLGRIQMIAVTIDHMTGKIVHEK